MIMAASIVQYVFMRLEGAAKRRDHKENPYMFGSVVQALLSRGSVEHELFDHDGLHYDCGGIDRSVCSHPARGQNECRIHRGIPYIFGPISIPC